MKKDFFISYNHKDEKIALWIEKIINKDCNYSTIMQALDFHLGSNIGVQMDNAAKVCERTIAVLSTNYLHSDYTKPEWIAAFMKDPTGENRKLLPILIEDGLSIGGLLGNIRYINLPEIRKLFIDLDDPEAEIEVKKIIIEEVKAAVEGRRINRGEVDFPFKKKS